MKEKKEIVNVENGDFKNRKVPCRFQNFCKFELKKHKPKTLTKEKKIQKLKSKFEIYINNKLALLKQKNNM